MFMNEANCNVSRSSISSSRNNQTLPLPQKQQPQRENTNLNEGLHPTKPSPIKCEGSKVESISNAQIPDKIGQSVNALENCSHRSLNRKDCDKDDEPKRNQISTSGDEETIIFEKDILHSSDGTRSRSSVDEMNSVDGINERRSEIESRQKHEQDHQDSALNLTSSSAKKSPNSFSMTEAAENHGDMSLNWYDAFFSDYDEECQSERNLRRQQDHDLKPKVPAKNSCHSETQSRQRQEQDHDNDSKLPAEQSANTDCDKDEEPKRTSVDEETIIFEKEISSVDEMNSVDGINERRSEIESRQKERNSFSMTEAVENHGDMSLSLNWYDSFFCDYDEECQWGRKLRRQDHNLKPKTPAKNSYHWEKQPRQKQEQDQDYKSKLPSEHSSYIPVEHSTCDLKPKAPAKNSYHSEKQPRQKQEQDQDYKSKLPSEHSSYIPVEHSTYISPAAEERIKRPCRRDGNLSALKKTMSLPPSLAAAARNARSDRFQRFAEKQNFSRRHNLVARMQPDSNGNDASLPHSPVARIQDDTNGNDDDGLLSTPGAIDVKGDRHTLRSLSYDPTSMQHCYNKSQTINVSQHSSVHGSSNHTRGIANVSLHHAVALDSEVASEFDALHEELHRLRERVTELELPEIRPVSRCGSIDSVAVPCTTIDISNEIQIDPKRDFCYPSKSKLTTYTVKILLFLNILIVIVSTTIMVIAIQNNYLDNSSTSTMLLSLVGILIAAALIQIGMITNLK